MHHILAYMLISNPFWSWITLCYTIAPISAISTGIVWSWITQCYIVWAMAVGNEILGCVSAPNKWSLFQMAYWIRSNLSQPLVL